MCLGTIWFRDWSWSKEIKSKRRTLRWCKTWCWDKLARERMKWKDFFSGFCVRFVRCDRNRSFSGSHGKKSGFDDSQKGKTIDIINLLQEVSPFFQLDCCASSSRCERRPRSLERREIYGRIWPQSRCRLNSHPISKFAGKNWNRKFWLLKISIKWN